MAEETTTLTPRQMGSHLRAVRRRKGLSLSEVARGAGLNRRELVNYERGKAPIPESDLWVLAGSIGVDISELVPPATGADVPAPSTNVPALRNDNSSDTIGDAVAMLRRGSEEHESSPHLGTLRVLQQLPEGKRVPVKDRELAAIAADLGSTPAEVELRIASILGCDALEAARIRAILMSAPQHGRRGRKVKALGAGEAEPAARYQAPLVPPPAASEPAPTEHAAVDVFEELARLPEPLPLPEENSVPDITATPPAPEGAVELVDHDTFPSLGDRFGFKQPAMAESTTAVASASAATVMRSGADAPPIDVAMRNDDWSWSGPDAGTTNGATNGMPTGEPLARRPRPADAWTPDAPDGAVPAAFWEGTDEWTPAGEPAGATIDETVDAIDTSAANVAADADPNALWSFEPAAVDPWIAGGWPESNAAETSAPAESVDGEWPTAAFTPVENTAAHPADIWGDAGGPSVVDAPEFATAEEPTRDFATSEFASSNFVSADFASAGTHAPDTDTDNVVDASSWDHTPDPAAVDSGFVVDWGEADDDQSDEPTAGQWASTGTWDEPLTPVWEVQTPASGAATDDTPVTAVVDAHETFDAYDAFAADPFAAATDDATDDVTAAPTAAPAAVSADPGDPGFSFGSELAAALAATYLPDGAEEPETPEALVDAPEFETPETPEPTFEPTFGPTFGPAVEPALETPAATFEPPEFETAEFETPEFETELAEAAPVDELPRIVWRADAFGNVDAVDDREVTPAPEPEPEPEFEEVFVTAGADWQLGNAVPLVEVGEVGNAGALVMRRADERWALADVTTTDDFALEVHVDFRSGPGLGVLFRASVDDEGRMSGYSFDIDPIYDGGGFLVRQWQDDRELWNPIARVASDDPNTMYGTLTVRLEVHGETLTAFVNGAEVMTVDDLAQASVERDREAARGDRVGVQAWSSSDLVIETLRIAAH